MCLMASCVAPMSLASAAAWDISAVAAAANPAAAAWMAVCRTAMLQFFRTPASEAADGCTLLGSASFAGLFLCDVPLGHEE